MGKSQKIIDLLPIIKTLIHSGHYYDTTHAKIRQKERKITLPEILYVLLNGAHEKSKDRFDEIFNAWNYAIRGKTVDERLLRIIVSFEQETKLLIITAIQLKN